MTTGLELAANVFNAASIVLAGRRSLHTWWTGIAGCALFALVFFRARLYADVTLQIFFIGSSLVGWWNWRRRRGDAPLRPVRRTPGRARAALFLLGAAAALGYGALLHHFTDAYAPVLDSVVLAFSVIGQLLLVDRRVESWWCWLLVNAIAVPLYFSRDLHLTAVLYAGFFVNAVIALRAWRRLADAASPA